MTEDQISDILMEIEFFPFDNAFAFVIMPKGDGFLLQVLAGVKDNKTGKASTQKGGKYYISSHAIKDEVVMTAWKACQDYVIHECREAFKYKGQAIFGPHHNVDELAIFTKHTPEVKRIHKLKKIKNETEKV